jgi:putative ABC transport system substrate-binding protein
MWRTTIGILITLILGILGMPHAPHAQPPGKVYRVGYLTLMDGIDQAFREEMHQLGYIEGQNLVLESRFVQGQYERLPALAAELVQLGVEVMVTVTTPAALVAKDATTTIPFVMAGVSNPVEHGLVASLARPGGNLTGVTTGPGPGFSGKLLELLKEAVPAISRVGVFWDSTFQTLRGYEAAAQVLGLTVLAVDVREMVVPEHFAAAFATILQGRAEALVVTAAAPNARHYQHLVDVATAHRLPTMFQDPHAVEAGGLMSYYLNWADQRRRAAVYVDKILKGAKPADLPVQQPMRLELVINLKTAKAFGLTIPPTLLFQAEKVIQ